MTYDTLLLEKTDGVAWIRLNRPKAYNALSFQMAEEVHDALLACHHDPAVRVVVLAGEGKAFCAGGDVRAFHEQGDDAAEFLRRLTHVFHGAVSLIARMDAPVIASVGGPAAGGGMGFVVAPDLVLAGESASFTLAYTGIGACPDGANTFFLPRLVGLRRAMELALLNRKLSAEEALAWGLVNRVVPDEDLARETEALARRLAAGPAKALAATKRLLNRGMAAALDEQLAEESQTLSRLGATRDFREGVTAFVEKRPPRFGD